MTAAYNVMTLLRWCRWCGDLAVAKGFSGGEQPIEHLPQLGRRHPTTPAPQIGAHIVHRARQDVQLVMKCVEFGPRDDQLALGQLELTGPLSGHPVPLPTACGAELPGSTGPLTLGQRPAAPSTSSGLFHTKILS